MTDRITPQGSTIQRPSTKELSRFSLRDIRDDKIRDYLEKGWSLGICCQDCPRLVEWTPFDLQQRFGERPDTRIVEIAKRLSCAGEGGCGSKKIAVFPHCYDGRWTWAG